MSAFINRLFNHAQTTGLPRAFWVTADFPWQRYTFSEEELIDWTLTSPGGSEEGNFIGKFLRE
jgi:hypothetical protein